MQEGNEFIRFAKNVSTKNVSAKNVSAKNVLAKILPIQILQVTERYGNDYERKNVSDTGSG